MKNKILICVIVCLLFISVFSYSQAKDSDKYSTVNVTVARVYSTSLGLIIEYYAGGKFRQAYLPHKFFNDGIAVKVLERNYRATPQINLIYKNLEPFKVKLYMPAVTGGYVYQVLEFLTQEQIDKFNSTDKLIFTFSDNTGEK